MGVKMDFNREEATAVESMIVTKRRRHRCQHHDS